MTVKAFRALEAERDGLARQVERWRAMVVEQRQELEQRTEALTAARREVERLRADVATAVDHVVAEKVATQKARADVAILGEMVDEAEDRADRLREALVAVMRAYEGGSDGRLRDVDGPGGGVDSDAGRVLDADRGGVGLGETA